MNTRKKSGKTIFSHLGPSILTGGMLSILGIANFFIAALKPGCTGIAELFQHGVGFASCLLILLGVIFGCVFLWRVRFEETYATLYYCCFFPVRIKYSEVVHLEYFNQKYKKQNVPAAIYIHLSSGHIKYWNINIFSLESAKAVKNELEKRINSTENQREIPNIELWAKNALRPSTTEKVTWAAFAIITLLVGSWEIANQLEWNKRIRTWDKVNGIILKNTTKLVSRGKGSSRIADVEYKYNYKGKTYFGTRIVYDSTTFPNLKVGKNRQVIVNPEKPQESAIMFWYRGKWGFVRYIKSGFSLLLSLGFVIIFLRMQFIKKIIVPSRLKSYVNSIPPERFYAALKIEQRSAVQNNIKLQKRMEYLQNFRYGIVRNDFSKLSLVIWSMVLLLAVALSIYIPACWIIAAIIGFVIYSMQSPLMMVFDFQEKKFFSCKNFDPEKRKKRESFSFAEVDHLHCQVLSSHHSGYFVSVFAVTHDGKKLPLFKVAPKRLEPLFEMLPELAEKMGNLSITY